MSIQLLNSSKLPYVYLVYAIPLLIFCWFIAQPFERPDELNHFYRTYQITHGEVFSHRFSEHEAGGQIDKNAIRFGTTLGITLTKLSPEKLASSKQLYWTKITRLTDFPNTAVYPPWNYLPQAFGLGIGQLFNLSIYNTYQIASLLNGLTAVLICFLALFFSRSMKPLLFTVALLPMSNYLFCSLSQDALLISSALFFIALIDYLIQTQRTASCKQTILLLILLFTITTSRPPYLGIGLLLLTPALHFFSASNPKANYYSRYLLLLMTLISIVTWLYLIQLISWSDWAIWAQPSPSKQIALLIHHPRIIIEVIINTLQLPNLRFYLSTLIGYLIQPYQRFPIIYYALSAIVISLAIILSRGSKDKNFRLLALACLVITTIMIFAVGYLTWNSVNSSYVAGIQGRYFLILVPLLGVALGCSNSAYFLRLTSKTRGILFNNLASILIMVFPLITYGYQLFYLY